MGGLGLFGFNVLTKGGKKIMLQIMQAGDIYHCHHCHKYYRYRGEVTGCMGNDCCHGADHQLTEDEVWKYLQEEKKILGINR